MAGVTFLAFGNGSPDVFSTFAAIRTNSGSLAVGELIGAAGFITAVVSGSMALVRPFKVARKSFVRDVGFFIVAISFSMVFVANGSLELWECAAMVGFYVFYVITVVVWHWWLGQRRKRREQYAIARGFYVDAEGEGELDFEAEYRDEDEPRSTRRSARHPSLTELNDLERADEEREDFDELDEETERDKWMGELSRNMRITRTPIGERPNIFNPIRPSLVGALEFQSVLHSLRKSRNIQAHPLHTRRFSDDPIYTLAQQQVKKNSTASDPETASHAESSNDAAKISNPEPHRPSAAQQGDHGRGRAKSANAADLLGLSPATWHQRQRSRSNLSSPRPGSRFSDRDNLTVPGQSANGHTTPPQIQAPSPIVTVDPPPEDVGRDQSPAARPRSDTAELLTPPATQEVSESEDSPEDTLKLDDETRSRPQLRITPPTPNPNLVQSTTSSSTSRSSRARSPYRRSIFQEETIPSPESMFPVYPSALDAPPKPLRWWPYRLLVPPETILRTLFPTLTSWNEKTWLGKITGIVSAPSFFLLTITLPVVEPQADESMDETPTTTLTTDTHKPSRQGSSLFTPGPGSDSLARVAVSTEARTHQHTSPHRHPSQPAGAPELQETHPHAVVAPPREWNRWIVMVQCFTSPYLVVLSIWANFSDNRSPGSLVQPTLYTLVASSLALALLLLTTTPDQPPRWHFLLCFAGFVVSVTWISTIANEVVGVLKTIGVIFDISDAILGLTVFAVGNSMGDLVADITVARLGYPVMALSACFGGPMLNILLGIGLSGCYMVISRADHRHHKHPDTEFKFKPYKVEVSTTLLLSAVALLVTLCGLLIVVPLNKWMMDRRIGWGLVVLWVLATAGNLGVELSGLGETYG